MIPFDRALGAEIRGLQLGKASDEIVAKVREFETKSGETLSSDPEENHFIINLDLKNISDLGFQQSYPYRTGSF